MKLWLLRPIEKEGDNPWWSEYDCVFGFVIRAVTEEEARIIAQQNGADETLTERGESRFGKSDTFPWREPQYSQCVELTTEGVAGIIITDFKAG